MKLHVSLSPLAAHTLLILVNVCERIVNQFETLLFLLFFQAWHRLQMLNRIALIGKNITITMCMEEFSIRSYLFFSSSGHSIACKCKTGSP